MENVFTEKSLKKYPSIFKKKKSQSQTRNKKLIVFSAVCYLQNVISTTKFLQNCPKKFILYLSGKSRWSVDREIIIAACEW